MTTTLRPTGPEDRAADGGRSRAYEICVNSRPVGAVRLAGEPRQGGLVGRMAGLRVEADERRRGRGTVAALAAEEVLRGWGCARVETSVPCAGDGADGAAGAHLLAALGYTEGSRHMIKALDAPPELPPGTAARPMKRAEFPAWWEHSSADFVADQIARGLTAEQAAAKTAATREAQLPDGAATSHAVLRVLSHRDEPVGTLWVSFAGLPRDDVDAWIFDVEVREERRGEGHGRALMHTAERECLAAGHPRLGLNVFGDNARARGLYTSLGFRAVELFYAKPLL